MKTNIEVVGNDFGAGVELLYVVIKKDDEPIENGLFRLQHPGNLEVDRWNESMVKQSEGDMTFATRERTKKFFDQCVYPVESGNSEIEKTLIARYGANTGGKLQPNSIRPNLYGVWQKLQTRFFGGDIFDDVPEVENPTNSSGVAESSKSVRKK